MLQLKGEKVLVLPFIANMNECEDNEDSERDGQNEEKARSYDLCQRVWTHIVQHVLCHPCMSEIIKHFNNLKSWDS